MGGRKRGEGDRECIKEEFTYPLELVLRLIA